MSCIGDEFKGLDKGTENPPGIDTVVLESDVSECGSNVGEGGGAAGVTVNTNAGSLGASCSSCAFRSPPPFLLKLYDMVENIETNSIVSWNATVSSFIVCNAHLFAANILPQYFRHNNFQSFVCQLNTYVSISSVYQHFSCTSIHFSGLSFSVFTFCLEYYIDQILFI